MKISIVYSFYNEEKNLTELINRTRKTMQSLLGLSPNEYEMIFVNDCSNDGSLKILEDNCRAHGDIKILNTSRTFGNAQCILAGFAFSTGEFIAYLDSDLQDPPELIEKMYKLAVANRLDIVHSKRTKRHGEGKIKMLITKIGYAILNYTMSVPIQPNVGDFKLLSRRVADSVLKMNEPLPFIRGMIAYVGHREGTIEYERSGRFAGETHFPVFSRRVISNFANNALIGYSDFPIHLIFYLSIFGLFIAALLAVYIIYSKLAGLAVPGTSSILLTVITFSSLIIMSIGIIGLYLASMKKALLRRPSYIIDSIFDAKLGAAVNPGESIPKNS